MRDMSERLETWVHTNGDNPDLKRLEEKMDPELADKIYELDRCIECGCCIAGCGTVRMRQDFVATVGLNKIARFRLDPRDHRNDDDFYELIAKTRACSAACRFWAATTSARKTCRCLRRSRFSEGRWPRWDGSDVMRAFAACID